MGTSLLPNVSVFGDFMDNVAAEIKLEGIHVLVVDDAPDNRLLVSRFLKIAGATSESASDGPQGIEKAIAGDFDVILMDIQMPVMDGYEVVEKLRSMSFDRPIIALTAHAMKSERDRCLQSGFDAYLTKPIARNELLAMIRNAVEKFAGRRSNNTTQNEDIQPDPDGQRAPQAELQNQDRIRH
jgi:CheY-like chemotaxis protein